MMSWKKGLTKNHAKLGEQIKAKTSHELNESLHEDTSEPAEREMEDAAAAKTLEGPQQKDQTTVKLRDKTSEDKPEAGTPHQAKTGQEEYEARW